MPSNRFPNTTVERPRVVRRRTGTHRQNAGRRRDAPRVTATPARRAALRTADLDVVVLGGAGHVGLPLSLVLADAGLRVGVFDLNETSLDTIRGGRMPFTETDADALLRSVLPTGRLELDSDADMIGRANVVIVVIGTPVDEFLNPSMTVFERAVDQISPSCETGRWWSCAAPSTRAPPNT